jgi:hypothetical protein
MEDLFPKDNISTGTLPSLLSTEFSVIHTKRIEFSDIEIPEFSLLNAMISSLEDIILNFPQKVVVIAEKRSCAMGIQLYLNFPEKIQSLYCIDSEFLYDLEQEKNPLNAIWDWFSKREDFVILLPKLPYILDFYFRYGQFEEHIKKDFLNSRGNLHFIHTGKLSKEPFSHLQNATQRNNISLIEPGHQHGSAYDNPNLQKILLHFLQKDYLQISKE